MKRNTIVTEQGKRLEAEEVDGWRRKGGAPGLQVDIRPEVKEENDGSRGEGGLGRRGTRTMKTSMCSGFSRGHVRVGNC